MHKCYLMHNDYVHGFLQTLILKISYIFINVSLKPNEYVQISTLYLLWSLTTSYVNLQTYRVSTQSTLSLLCKQRLYTGCTDTCPVVAMQQNHRGCIDSMIALFWNFQTIIKTAVIICLCTYSQHDSCFRDIYNHAEAVDVFSLFLM